MTLPFQRPHESFEARLAALDEAVANHEAAPMLRALDDPPDVREKLRESLQVLTLLESVWPRRKKTAEEPALVVQPTQIGRFKIVRELGRGGFATVYLADDPLRGGTVALKVPHWHVRGSADLCRRFLREAQATALLDHPNILPLIEVGEAEPMWYLVSPYCAGPSLAQWLAQQTGPMAPDSAAVLVATLAGAVQHMHERGVVHRDLKPGNVLLQSAGTPDSASTLADFTPKITDFGLAKLLEREADDTVSQTVLGTPLYMAPEQAQGRRLLIGPATDVYALGAILYELLTGRPPIEGDGLVETLRRVSEDEIAPTRDFQERVPRDLKAICLKCLAKRPESRYSSAAALAEDLQRFLRREPTQARPLSNLQRLGRWAQRRPSLVALWGTLALAVVAFLIGGAWHTLQLEQLNAKLAMTAQSEHQQALEAQVARQKSDANERLARQRAYVAGCWSGGQFLDEDRLGLVDETLNQLRPRPGESDLREFAWRYLWQVGDGLRVLRGHSSSPQSLAFSPDGRTCFSLSTSEHLEWDASACTLLSTSTDFPSLQDFKRFSRDGRTVMSIWNSPRPGERLLQATDLGSGKLIPAAPLRGNWSWDVVAVAPDGQSVALLLDQQDRGQVLLLDVETGRERKRWHSPGNVITCLAFSADGRSLAIGSWRGPDDAKEASIRICDLRTGVEQLILNVHRDTLNSLAWSKDGKHLACSSADRTTTLWDTKSLKRRHELPLWAPELEGLAFAPDDQTLAAITRGAADMEDQSRGVTLWDVATGIRRPEALQLPCDVYSLAYSYNGDVLAVGGRDHLVRLWKPERAPARRNLPGHGPREAWAVAFLPNSGALATAGDDHRIIFWDVAKNTQIGAIDAHRALVSCLAASPDGRWLASGGYDDQVIVWDTAKLAPHARCEGHSHDVRCLAFSPDGGALASAGRDLVIRLWDAPNGRALEPPLPGHAKQVRSLAFSPDHRVLASAGDDGDVHLWDWSARRLLHTLSHRRAVWSLTFSPDGTRIVTGEQNGGLNLWRVADGKHLGMHQRHGKGIRTLAVSPDGQTLASGSEDRTVRLWHFETFTELLTLPPREAEINGVAFSSDGTRLAAAVHDGSIAVWHGPR